MASNIINTTSNNCYIMLDFSYTQEIAIPIFYYLTPFYFVFGLIGHILCLLAFFRRSKNEKAYMYQIFLTISELCSIIGQTFYIITYQWLSSKIWPTPLWYESCYVCMWITYRMSISLSNALTTTTLLFSVCMACDRFRALYNPTTYREGSKKLYFLIIVSCVTIGFSTSFHQVFSQTLISVLSNDIEIYQPISSVFRTSIIFTIADQSRNAVRFIGLLILLFCNLGIPYLYRKKVSNSKAITKNQIEEKRRRKQAKLLFILSLSESLCATLSVSALIAFFLIFFFSVNASLDKALFY